jgi:hypothetical protein
MAPPITKKLPRASIAPRNAASGLTSAAGPSRVPRVSAAFHMTGAAPYPSAGKRRESGLGIVRERLFNVNKKISDQDIDDKVSFQLLAVIKQSMSIFFRYLKQSKRKLNAG